MKPKLRSIQTLALVHQGRPAIMLRDPLHLTDHVIILPQPLIPLLTLLDGQCNLPELQASLIVRMGLRLSIKEIADIVEQLDLALLLDSPRFVEARQSALETYRQGNHRQPSSAGGSYPTDPDKLRVMLDQYLADVPQFTAWSQGRGLVSPHIDYERGGAVYAQVWAKAAEFVRQADLAIVLGTDHNGSEGQVTLTRQNYATPYGVLPTPLDLVDKLAQAIGPDAAFAEELHHVGEHSIELAAVWLHHVRQGRPIDLLPVLCGSFHHFILTPFEPAKDDRLNIVIETLREALEGRSAVVVAAGDLAHVGPAFGDSQPVDLARKAELAAKDEKLIGAVCAGDAQAFYDQLKAEQDRRNVCGLPPIYMTLRLLGETRGEPAGYDRCPADKQNTSWVSICGVVLA